MSSKSNNLQHSATSRENLKICSGSASVDRNSSNHSPKMGSRRIFTPQFKLKVLESYRSDNDCKGNQRATARKYNIHRRQIQKWLQCETNLRSSVANIIESNVKDQQFHNNSHHQQQQQQQQLAAQQLKLPIVATSENNHYCHSYHEAQLHQHELYSDITRQFVAFKSTTVVPSLTARVNAASSTTPTQGALVAANLAAVVTAAAAAAAGGVGAMSIASTNTKTTTAPVSPLRPTAIGGSAGAPVSAATVLHPHNHHHYIMPFTHTPASLAVSVPLLTHHIHSPHMPRPYLYHHNLPPHTHSHTHTQALHQSHKASVFMPSACLPVTVSSAATLAAATSAAGVKTTFSGDSTTEAYAVEQSKAKYTGGGLRDSTKATSSRAILTGNSFVHGDECLEIDAGNEYQNKYKCLHEYAYTPPRLCPSGFLVTPMDLSLSSRRDASENKFSLHDDLDNGSNNVRESIAHDDSIVDLTSRKRKANTTTSESEDISGERVSKHAKIDSGKEQCRDQHDVKVKVEQNVPTSKPVKLFKPYLLDDSGVDFKSSDAISIEQREPIIWSNHPRCLSPHSCDSRQDSSRGSNFQCPFVEKSTFPIGSSDSPASKPSSPQSAFSPTSGTKSPRSFHCPKGSPVSGYESSSSIYSDSSCRTNPFSIDNRRNYTSSIDLEMPNNDKMIVQQSHLERWLNQDENVISTASTSIIF